jgi:class 3 adenylate cyclase
MIPPETHYAKSGNLRIAYQVVGHGVIDLVLVPGFVTNIDMAWEVPEWASYRSRLARFSRLILFDKRGTGLSDRTAGYASLEERMDDVRAVMDAAGSDRAALFGISEGGPMSVLFAATYPQRVQAMVLYGAYAQHPLLASEDEVTRRVEEIDRLWGTGEYTLSWFTPSISSEEAARRSAARFERASASPAAVIAQTRMSSAIDTRHILPAVRVPTMIIHRVGDHAVPVEAGRYLAANIPGAKYLELPGDNHSPWYEPDIIDRIIGETEEFLTGSRGEAETDRVLATVMFIDIVESTKRAGELGDRRWRALLDQHDETVRQQLTYFRGREVKTLGDGFLATFDGPTRAVRCASAIAAIVRQLGISVRCGLHTGEIELKPNDIGGIAVHMAARVAGVAEPGETVVSSTVRDLVAGSGLRFHDRGLHELRGFSEKLHLYSLLTQPEYSP